MSTDIVPVVLAGGSGTRLWPLSRTAYPKQFIPLIEDTSLFVSTLLRGKKISSVKPIVVCNEEHRFLVAEQLRISLLEQSTILLEPKGRNTAPAIALAALAAMQNGDDPLLLISPSDHLLQDDDTFVRVVEEGKLLAQENKMVTFGIEPTRADTAYGYIQLEALGANVIKRFVEKPDQDTADTFWRVGTMGGTVAFFFSVHLFILRNSKNTHRISSGKRLWHGETIR